MEDMKSLIKTSKELRKRIETRRKNKEIAKMRETSDQKLIEKDEDVTKAGEFMEMLAVEKTWRIWEELFKEHDVFEEISEILVKLEKKYYELEEVENRENFQMKEKTLKRKYKRKLKKKCSKIKELEDRIRTDGQINNEHERELKKKCSKIKELEDRMVKQGQINDELQEARQELIRGLGDYTVEGSTMIGLKKLGGTDLSELWNFEQGREATLKEVITYIIHQNKKLKTIVDIFC